MGVVGKSEGRWTFGKPRHRRKDNNKMDLHEFGSGLIDWIGLAQNRDVCWALVNAVINPRFT
jgi:hypothetical protein